MKTFFSNLIPKIKNYSQKIDDTSLLINKNWVAIDDQHSSKYVYIFRENAQLIIAKNGRVEKRTLGKSR